MEGHLGAENLCTTWYGYHRGDEQEVERLCGDVGEAPTSKTTNLKIDVTRQCIHELS